MHYGREGRGKLTGRRRERVIRVHVHKRCVIVLHQRRGRLRSMGACQCTYSEAPVDRNEKLLFEHVELDEGYAADTRVVA